MRRHCFGQPIHTSFAQLPVYSPGSIIHPSTTSQERWQVAAQGFLELQLSAGLIKAVSGWKWWGEVETGRRGVRLILW